MSLLSPETLQVIQDTSKAVMAFKVRNVCPVPPDSSFRWSIRIPKCLRCPHTLIAHVFIIVLPDLKVMLMGQQVHFHHCCIWGAQNSDKVDTQYVCFYAAVNGSWWWLWGWKARYLRKDDFCSAARAGGATSGRGRKTGCPMQWFPFPLQRVFRAPPLLSPLFMGWTLQAFSSS